jgi:hypothetical protein
MVSWGVAVVKEIAVRRLLGLSHRTYKSYKTHKSYKT